MKISFVFFLLFSLFVYSTFAQNKESQIIEPKGLLGSAFLLKGKMYSYHLTSDDFQNSPSWEPIEGDPPLSIQSAVRIAKENLSRFVKTSKSMTIKWIQLYRVDVGKWVYEISFDCDEAKCNPQKGNSFPIFVKMDGFIIEPKPEKEAPIFPIIVKRNSKKSPAVNSR